VTEAAVASPAALDREHALRLLAQMLRIRRFEEKAAEVYSLGKIRGFLHLYIGEEACAVGAMQSLRPEDAVVATYRDHGHALARGLPARELMAEMYGKAAGCSRGRGGSMHFFDASRRFYGGYGIVGGGLPIATGLALADRMRGRQVVTACFFGEGAAVEGEFHETLNLAALWQLPVLFLCENNRYAMGTAIDHEMARTEVAARAATYGIPSQIVDGMDVVAVEAAVHGAAEAVRRGAGPYFIELMTYRFRAHSMADPDLYRTKEEVEEWRRERDPIELFTSRLRREGLLDADTLAALEEGVSAEIDEALAFADAAEPEDTTALGTDVYAETGS
jgi:pyruvate dehydrogenase E1 component alpha subunit